MSEGLNKRTDIHSFDPSIPTNLRIAIANRKVTSVFCPMFCYLADITYTMLYS